MIQQEKQVKKLELTTVRSVCVAEAKESRVVKMSKVNETLQHINTDLNYVGQDELNADENIINFQ